MWLPLSQSIPDTGVLNLQCLCVNASGRKNAVRDEIRRLQSTISRDMPWQINQGNTSMLGAQSGDFLLTQVRDNESKGLQWDWYFELILMESLECLVYCVGAAMDQQSRLMQENHNCNTHTHMHAPRHTHAHVDLQGHNSLKSPQRVCGKESAERKLSVNFSVLHQSPNNSYC